MSDLENKQGRAYWRSLEQLANNPESRYAWESEHIQESPEEDNSWSRRNFLTLMGASLALAGLAGCRRPVEKVVPYVKQPEEVTPGVPQYYATTMPLGMSSYGLLVKTNEGRPTKIEGNKDHPSSLSSTNIFAQGAILGLYDPDRSSRILHNGSEKTWDDFVAFWRERHAHFQATQGQGLAFLTESFCSPTMARLSEELRQLFPKSVWATHEPISDENRFAGIRAATGKLLQPVYHVEKAKVILALDSDFLQTEGENVTALRGFADGRRIRSQADQMNRLYVVESGHSVTGSMADHRLRMQSCQVGQFALALAQELSRQGLRLDFLSRVSIGSGESFDSKWLGALARDLVQSRGESLILSGYRQPPFVHGMILAMNEALGNIGTSVTYRELKDAAVPNQDELTKMTETLKSGLIDTLVILGSNPVYTAPVDNDFVTAMKKATHTIHLGSHVDETARNAEWHLSQAHFLETWGDARAVDGTVSVVQPLIEPLFNGKSSVELMALLATGQNQSGYEVVRETWKALLPATSYEKSWRTVLHDGLLKGSGSPAVQISVDAKSIASQIAVTGPADPDRTEIVFGVSHLYDGRFANVGWLQELPDPITKLTWDNVASMSKSTADSLGVENGDMIQLELQGHTVNMPIWITPGHADKSVSVQLGYGRRGAGKVSEGVGFNSYAVRTREALDFGSGLTMTRLGTNYPLSSSQNHGSMEGRPIIREATLAQYKDKDEFFPKAIEHPALVPLWDEHSYVEGYQWGMTIDLNSCTGCNACAIACQAENNIPIVGKEQVAKGRFMHWIRLDRYFAGSIDEPESVHQPMACQHCENAPCEQVCPVAATVHDREGLNVMVYNRCIGTRYCSNNCPYKVRRFNFFNYTKDLPETVRMQQNPDVTVRSRGVMEKCTYCVQRITSGKYAAKREGREVKDGEIISACQQVCPAQAIVFGNVNDPGSRVSQLKKLNRNYAVLEEFNTKPRTTYLAKLRNPNPELVRSSGANGGHE